MIIHCDKGGEHKACNKCGKVFSEQKNLSGAPMDYAYHHTYYQDYGSPVGALIFCEDCRIKWDNMTKLWLKETMFVVRRDDAWVEVSYADSEI